MTAPALPRRRRPITGWTVAKNVFAWLLSASMLVPLLLIIVTSFKSDRDGQTMSFAWPQEWNPANFVTVIQKGKLGAGFLNSLLYSSVGTVVTVLLAAMAAYVFSRRRSRGNQILYLVVVMGIVLPINYVALMKVMQLFALNNSRIGIIALYIAVNIPFTVFLIYGFVARIPVELDEAAVIDGCGPIRLFFLIILPLMRPVLITAAVLGFLGMWNEFIMPLYFLDSTAKWPMNLAVYNFFGRFESKWNLVSADVLLTAAPVIVLYLVCQKYIVGGQTVGAVKG
ncbi:MAG: carbohydrate ABC transporter permease [Propionibacteriaceae bacterium]|jgi:raffinose/stachyose/melibiose transport system permease protein|nr:carbohydrate ABC transporter permease [Propionibacteriaceae bacterium]